MRSYIRTDLILPTVDFPDADIAIAVDFVSWRMSKATFELQMHDVS